MSKAAKLVRDLLSARIPAAELHVETDGAALVALLDRKLDEEVAELRASGFRAVEEFADVVEVLHALAARSGISAADIESARMAKRDERGGFARGLVWTPPRASAGATTTAASLGVPVPAAGEAHVYADGGSAPNPGPGGWAAVVVMGDGSVREVSGAESASTNNRMELMAAAAGLREAAGAGAKRIVMRLDSKYVQDGITSWIHGWKRKGWVTASGDPVKNRELWQELDAAVTAAKAGGARVDYEWIKGHSGNPGNERADELVGLARSALRRKTRGNEGIAVPA